MYKTISLITAFAFTTNAFSAESNEKLTLRDYPRATVKCSTIPLFKKPIQLEKFEPRTTVYEQIKQDFLEKANFSRQDANEYLKECQKYANFIPNLDIRNQVNALIATTISSLAVPLAKEKFQLVLLALIGQGIAQMALDTYDNYVLLKKNAEYATISLEECNCYLSLALSAEVYHHSDIDYDTYYYDLNEIMEEAIQYLIIVEMHTVTMQRPLDIVSITDQCFMIKKRIFQEIEHHGRIISNHSNSIEKLMSDALKIFSTASCEDRESVNEIYSLIQKACKKIKIIEDNILK